MSYSDFDVDKARELREKAKDSFIRQFRWDFGVTLLVSVPVFALLCYTSTRWAAAWEPESRMSLAVLYLLSLLLLMLIWAIHGVTARLLFISKEIKQLRLDFLSSRESPLEQATGGAESFFTWMTLAIRPRTLALLLVGFLVLVPTATWLLYGVKQHAALQAAQRENRTYENRIYETWRGHTFGGQEEVEIHFTPEGAVRTLSRITITKSPDLLAPVPIRIPQPGATLESVTISGRKTPVVAVPGMKDTYSVMPGMPEAALKGATMEVVWSIPMAAMGFGEDSGCKFRLLGIIPVNSYTAKAVIDEGAPYLFDSQVTTDKSYTMFTAKLEDYEAGEMGYCGIKLHYALLEGQTP